MGAWGFLLSVLLATEMASGEASESESRAAAVEATSATIAPTNQAPTDAFVLRRWEMVPPAAPPRVIIAQFPITSPMLSVESMAWADGRLWMGARLRTVPQVPTYMTKLWMFSPENNRLEQVPGPVEKNDLQGMMAAGRRLWLSLEGGAGALDTQTLAIDPFGPSQGLTANHLAGFADGEGAFFAIGRSGAGFHFAPTGTNFVRAPGLIYPGAGAGPEPWQRAGASRQWLLAASDREVATRHIDAPQWTYLRDELSRNSPRLERPHLWSLEGDGEGGFWLGSDQGLHWVHPEDGAVENRFMPSGVFVAGGLGMTLSRWQKPTAAAYTQARERVMNGIRDRMLMRARFARLSADAKTAVSPVVPTSRVPGGVTALLRDKNLLWVATTDGRNTNQSRVLLYQPTSRKWVGWFAIPYPIRCMAANDRVLFLGLEVPLAPRISPLVAVEKFPLLAIPATRWVDDEVTPAEVERRVSGLPPRERHVFWFFSGQPQRVMDALAPDGQPGDDLSAESLFLLAFANDAVGLDRPDQFLKYANLLLERHPGSVYAELARTVADTARDHPLPSRRRPSLTPAIHKNRDAVPEDGNPGAAPDPSTAPENPPETAAEVLARRDLDGDGRLNPVEFRFWRGDNADFKKADTNQDGFLDLGEIEAILAGK